jgi:hypothetical protein
MPRSSSLSGPHHRRRGDLPQHDERAARPGTSSRRSRRLRVSAALYGARLQRHMGCEPRLRPGQRIHDPADRGDDRPAADVDVQGHGHRRLAGGRDVRRRLHALHEDDRRRSRRATPAPSSTRSGSRPTTTPGQTSPQAGPRSGRSETLWHADELLHRLQGDGRRRRDRQRLGGPGNARWRRRRDLHLRLLRARRGLHRGPSC